jgi:hypothetical protein
MRMEARLGVIVALATGISMAWMGARADEPQPATSETARQETATTPPEPDQDAFEPEGAGGIEPDQRTAEGPRNEANEPWWACKDLCDY